MQTFIIFYDYDNGQREKSKSIRMQKGKEEKQQKKYGGELTRTPPVHTYSPTFLLLHEAAAVVMAHANATNTLKAYNIKFIRSSAVFPSD